MLCNAIDRHLADYLEDRASEDERSRLRRHLGDCERCRLHALDTEPTLAFALLESVEPSEFEIERNVSAVRTLIRQERMRQALEGDRQRRRQPLWLAAAAAVILVAGASFWLRPPASTQIAEEQAEPTIAAAAESEVRTPRDAPRVEVAMDESVRVYQMDAEEDAAFVVIVNPALEL